jgi:hypothetical protein
LIDGLQDAFSEAFGLFEPFEDEEQALKEGWLTVPSEELRSRFARVAEEGLESFGLPTDIPSRLVEGAEFVASSSGDLIAEDAAPTTSVQPSGLGGRRGMHTEDFEQLWADLTHTHREDPTATW